MHLNTRLQTIFCTMLQALVHQIVYGNCGEIRSQRLRTVENPVLLYRPVFKIAPGFNIIVMKLKQENHAAVYLSFAN